MNQLQRQLLNDCSAVLQLKEQYGWKVIERDARANFDAISGAWFNMPDASTELKEARARQIANATLLSLMELYENKLKEVQAEIMEKEDPTNFQTQDVDNGQEEEIDE